MRKLIVENMQVAEPRANTKGLPMRFPRHAPKNGPQVELWEADSFEPIANFTVHAFDESPDSDYVTVHGTHEAKRLIWHLARAVEEAERRKLK